MAKQPRRSGGTPALIALATAGVEHTVHTYDHDARSESYGAEAADALGVAAERVFKTLLAEVDGTLTVAITPVTGELDLKGLARARDGRRAVMADPQRAQRATGYVVGGISPLGQRRAHPTVLDSSALEHPTIYVSAGRRGLEVELAAADLVRLTGAVVAPVGR